MAAPKRRIWSGLSLEDFEGESVKPEPSIASIRCSDTALRAVSPSHSLCSSILPSSRLTFRTPGMSISDDRSALRSIPSLAATSLGVRPTTPSHSTSGLCPRFSSTDEARDTCPLPMSRESLTEPSVAETLHCSIPGSLLTALVAFIAQSGQSIPLMAHSNSWTPSAARSASSTPVADSATASISGSGSGSGSSLAFRRRKPGILSDGSLGMEGRTGVSSGFLETGVSSSSSSRMRKSSPSSSMGRPFGGPA